MSGFLLLLIAIVLFAISLCVATLYNTFRSLFQKTNRLVRLWKLTKEAWRVIGSKVTLNKKSEDLAVIIDKAGNVVLGPLFNDILILPGGYKFGDEEETLSTVLGVNKEMNTFRNLGKQLAALLNRIDPMHVEKAAKFRK